MNVHGGHSGVQIAGAPSDLVINTNVSRHTKRRDSFLPLHTRSRSKKSRVLQHVQDVLTNLYAHYIETDKTSWIYSTIRCESFCKGNYSISLRHLTMMNSSQTDLVTISKLKWIPHSIFSQTEILCCVSTLT